MYHPVRQSNQGYIMVTILAVIAGAALVAGISLMFSTSSIQTAEHNMELRARALAESGIRYAAGEYRSAGSLAEKFQRLESLHREQVILSGNDGRFQLDIQSFWFVTNQAYSQGDTHLSLRVPGKFPDGFDTSLPATGTVKINNEFYRFSSATTTRSSGFTSDQAAIRLNQGLREAIAAHTSVQLVFSPPETQTITDGGDLKIAERNDTTDLFPQRNGLIQIFRDDKTEAGIYKYRERKTGSVILSGITPVRDSRLPMAIDGGSRVVVKKQARVGSGGSLGAGSIAANRGIDLNVFLTDEMIVPGDAPQDLDLNGGADGGHDCFNDEENGCTTLKNWDCSEDPALAESQRKAVTTQAVATKFGVSTNYLTFQNFSEIEADKGYTAELINKKRLPAAARTTRFNGVWGNASDNIYFVGDDGTLLHFDGQDFTTVSTGTGKDLNAVWGVPASKTDPDVTDNVLIVGDDGTVLVNEGNGWKSAKNGESYDVYAAWGTGWDHFDGYGEAGTNPYHWSKTDPGTKLKNYTYYRGRFGKTVNFRSLWAIKHKYPYNTDYGGSRRRSHQNIMVGEFTNGDGIIMHEFYEPPVVISQKRLRGVWGSSFANIYAVGDSGAIYQNKSGNAPDYEFSYKPKWADSWQGKWKKIKAGNIPTTQNLNGVFGNAADDFYVIGDNGTILYNKGKGFELVPTAEVTSETLNSIWGSDRTGIYAVGDNGTIVFLGYPVNKIGGHILPLNKNKALTDKWAATGRFLNYTVQAKIVWGDALTYAASGIVFRWHKAADGKYAGYGAALMQYDSSLNEVNDLIPDTIKPEFHGTEEKHDRLLLVLWEQYLQGGAEQRRWLAYKDITNDAKMKKANGAPVDHASLIVRVHEKRIEGAKVNDITLYYGNASDKTQSHDKRYNNTRRNRYNATFGKFSDPVLWPVFDLDDWTRCPNPPGNAPCNEVDAFTLVDNVGVSQTPNPPGADKYWILNPAADLAILKNSFTIRTGRFTTPDGPTFGTQAERSEIGLYVYGDIGGPDSQTRVSITDFALQLGVDSDAVNTQSSFGGLQ